MFPIINRFAHSVGPIQMVYFEIALLAQIYVKSFSGMALVNFIWMQYFFLIMALVKLFTLRPAPPAHPKCRKMAPTWHQHGAKNWVPHRPVAPRMGCSIGPRREAIEKSTNATKKGADFGRAAPFWSKTSQHGPNLAFKMKRRWSKKRSQHRSFLWCLLESIFG